MKQKKATFKSFEELHRASFGGKEQRPRKSNNKKKKPIIDGQKFYYYDEKRKTISSGYNHGKNGKILLMTRSQKIMEFDKSDIGKRIFRSENEAKKLLRKDRQAKPRKKVTPTYKDHSDNCLDINSLPRPDNLHECPAADSKSKYGYNRMDGSPYAEATPTMGYRDEYGFVGYRKK